MAGSRKVGLRASVWAADETDWPHTLVPQGSAQLDDWSPHVSFPLGIGLHVGPPYNSVSIVAVYGGNRRVYGNPLLVNGEVM